MYRLVVESLLGLQLDVDKLQFAPCLPKDWPGFKMQYRYRETVYRIEVVQTRVSDSVPVGTMQVTVDDVVRSDSVITLVDDRHAHSVVIHIPVQESIKNADLSAKVGA